MVITDRKDWRSHSDRSWDYGVVLVLKVQFVKRPKSGVAALVRLVELQKVDARRAGSVEFLSLDNLV